MRNHSNHVLSNREGFTLVEIIIAVSIFVFLAVMLVGFLQRGLDLWKTGESRGDIYERGQIVMEQIKKDLASVFNEPNEKNILTNNYNEALPLDRSYLFEPSLYSGIDNQGNQWLYLVRIDDDNYYHYVEPITQTPRTTITTYDFTTVISETYAVSPTYVKTKERVVYYINNSTLIRGEVDELASIAYWQQSLPQISDPPPVTNTQTFDNISYLGYRFSSGQPIWDSRSITQTAQAPQTGRFPSTPQNLPKTITVILDVKPIPLNNPKITLKESLVGDIATINIPRTLLGAGSFIKVDSEWLLVQSKSYYKLNVLRAQRNSILAPHSSGAEVQYGETIENTFYLPTAQR